MIEFMGKFTTGEKPKFDLITASRTKKYKIISGVILALGILLLIIGFILRGTVTQAVMPNALSIDNLSNLEGSGPVSYHCEIAQDQLFTISTSTPTEKALATPITFILDEDAQQFVEVRDQSDTRTITKANYQGLFYLHIKENAPAYIGDGRTDQDRPTGYLRIECGSRILRIKLTYCQKD